MHSGLRKTRSRRSEYIRNRYCCSPNGNHTDSRFSRIQPVVCAEVVPTGWMGYSSLDVVMDHVLPLNKKTSRHQQEEHHNSAQLISTLPRELGNSCNLATAICIKHTPYGTVEPLFDPWFDPCCDPWFDQSKTPLLNQPRIGTLCCSFRYSP